MKYKEMSNDAKKAFQIGLLYLVKHPIKSIWCEDGLGWQEIWETAPYAGLYASCMGIELLAKANKDDFKDLDLDLLISNVYKNVSCAMNEDIPIKDIREEKMRNANLNITLKSVKYLSCSLYISDQDKNSKIINRCLKILKDSLQENRSFLPAVNSNNESILTTYEAISYLKPYWDNNINVFKDCLLYFEEIIDEDISTDSDVDLKDRLLLALNIVSRYSEYFSTSLINKSVNLFVKFNNLFGNDKKIENRFHVPHCNNIQDTYSVSKPMMILDTLINFIEKGLIKEDYLNGYLDSILEIIHRVTEFGYYTYAKTDVSFCVNYYALFTLWRFSNFIDSNKKMKELEFMIVNPVLFNKKEFTLDENLVVVFMPFRPIWSNSVYKAFKECVEEKELIIWRSDIVHTDDQIIQTVWEKINQAKFVIADCTGRNPNVFYELGIAHTLGKPVFLCSQKDKDYPFDIGGIRHFNYDLHDFPKLKGCLKSFIEEKFKI